MDLQSSKDGYFIKIENESAQPYLRFAHQWHAPQNNDNTPPRHFRTRHIVDWQIFYQLEKRSYITLKFDTNNEETISFTLHPGELAIIPPQLEHAWWGESDSRHIALHGDIHAQKKLLAPHMVHFSNTLISLNKTNALIPYHIHWGNSQFIISPKIKVPIREQKTWLQHCQTIIQQQQRRRWNPLHDMQAHALFAHCFTQCLHWASASQQTKDNITIIEEVLQDAADRPLSQVSIAGLAKACKMSETSFRNAVKKQCGQAPRQIIERTRLERAAYLLRYEQDSITDVAQQVGYEDPYHFSRAFSKFHGKSPRTYRKTENI